MTTPPAPRIRIRPLLATVVLGVSLAVLTACTTDGGTVDSPDAPTATTTPTESLPPSEQPDFGAPAPDCEEILTADDAYTISPNLGAVAAPTPREGSVEASMVALEGTTCRWTNATSGIPLDVTVAVPSSEAFERLATETQSTATSTDAFGDAPDVRGFFDLKGDEGIVQVFTSDHWIVLRSPMFGEPEDAVPVVEAVVENVVEPGE
jgi:hypothetical protein